MPAAADPVDPADVADADAPDHGSSPGAGGPVVTPESVTLRLPRAAVGDGVNGIDLSVDWPLDGPPGFTRDGAAGWTFQLARPLAHRFEYQLTVHGADGDHITTDPTNPRRVPGPFGDKSEIRFPDYREPAWLAAKAAGTTTAVTDPAGGDIDAAVPIHLFAPDGLANDTAAPLLIAHDGSDMADRGSLLSWACAQPAPLRVALLDPPAGRRDGWYAADPAYADHVGSVVIDLLTERVATSHVIGLGASLGAVAMLTIHRRHPDALDGLALQSGSFFSAELDPQEASWPQFQHVCTAVAEFTDALPGELRTVPVLMTVGAIEENRANNEQMAGALAFQGYPVDARIVPDAHTMIGWRDAWSPGLTELLARTGRSAADRP